MYVDINYCTSTCTVAMVQDLSSLDVLFCPIEARAELGKYFVRFMADGRIWCFAFENY